ncbi:MAG: energy transducer TonB [Saprospiraceae bacterium]
MKMETMNLRFIFFCVTMAVVSSCTYEKNILQDRSTGEDETFKFVEQMPEFINGQAAMYKFIKDNLHYPQKAIDLKVTGTVVVQFVVNTEGKLINVKVARGIGSGCDEEAVRIVESMPDWKLGMHNGKAVPVSFTLPIKFKLE